LVHVSETVVDGFREIRQGYSDNSLVRKAWFSWSCDGRQVDASTQFPTSSDVCSFTNNSFMLTCDTVSAQPNSITLFASLRDLRHCVAKTHTTLQTLVNAIVISRLFYCNNVLVSLLAYPTQRLQSVMSVCSADIQSVLITEYHGCVNQPSVLAHYGSHPVQDCCTNVYNDIMLGHCESSWFAPPRCRSPKLPSSAIRQH